MSGEETKWIDSVAGLLALYGVFALVPVSVYLMVFNMKAYQGSTTETRKHCAAVHWVFVASTVFLMGAAGLFHYVQWEVEPVLWGSVAGLVDQEDLPVSSSGPIRLKQRLDAADHDHFYQTAPITDKRSRDRYRVHWALPAEKGLSSFVLRIQQEFTKPPADEGFAEADSSPTSAAARSPERILREKDFLVDLDSFPQLRKTPIKLTYALPPGTPPESIGVLMVKTLKGARQLPVSHTELADSRLPLQRSPALLGRVFDELVPRAWAQAADTSNQSGSLSASDSAGQKAIARGLHSEDIGIQATARKDLAASGPASCSLILSELEQSRSRDGSERGLLIHNLAKSLEDLERRTKGACRESYLPFAQAYYEIKDFALAVKFFDRIPEAEIRTTDEMYARGYAYYRVGGRDGEAIKSLSGHLAGSPTAISSAKAHLLLGRLQHRSGNRSAAIGHFRSAMSGKGAPRWARAMAANEIAYLYAVDFATVKDSLRVALPLVEIALAHDPQDPRFLDTKGWLLYGLGQCVEAESLLVKAAEAEPGNRDIQSHLQDVRARAGGRCA